MATITNYVRWADNTDELKRNLKEGINTIDAMHTSVDKLVESFQGDRLIAAANKWVAAIQQVGGAEKLNSSEREKANAILDKAIEKMEAFGRVVPDAMREAASATQSTNSVFNELWAHFAAGVTVGTLVAKAIEDVGSAAKDIVHGGIDLLSEGFSKAVKAASELETSQGKLSGALMASGRFATESIDAYTQLADAIAANTTTSKAGALEMEARFIELGNVSQEQMGRATQAALDLSAGLKIDLDTAVTAISRALEGNTTSLKRYGIALDETKVAAEGADYILGELNKRFGGQAQVEAESFAGLIKRMGNAWEELAASVGEFIVKDPIVGGTLRTITTAVDGLATAIKHANEEAGKKGVSQLLHDLYAIVLSGQGLELAGRIAGEAIAKQKQQQGIPLSPEDMAAINAPNLPTATPYPSGGMPIDSAAAAAQATYLRGVAETQIAATEAADRLQKKADEAAKKLRELAIELHNVEHAGESMTDNGLKPMNLNMEVLGRLGETVKIPLLTVKEQIEALQRAGEMASATLLKLGGAIASGGYHFNPSTGLSQENLTSAQLATFTPTPNVPESGNIQTLEKTKDKASELEKTLGTLSSAFTHLSQVSGGSLGTVAKDLGIFVSAAHSVATGINEIKAASDGLEGVAEKVASVATIIGAVITAYQVVSSMLGPSQRELEGRQALLNFTNSVRDSLSAAEKSALTTTQMQQTHHGPVAVTVQDTFAQTQAGLAKQFAAAGMPAGDIAAEVNSDMGLLLDAYRRGGSAVQAVIDGITARLDVLKQHQKDVQTGVDAIATSFVKAGQQILSSTIVPYIPKDTLDNIKTLLSMPGLTADQRSQFQGLLDSATPSFKNLLDIADKYNISLKQLGPSFQEKNLEAQAHDLYNDFKLLTDAGADANGVMDGMASNIQGLVSASLTFKTKIPDNMKPFIQHLIDAGTLVDLDGRKITDMGALSFEATPLDQGIQDLNSTLKDLIHLLTYGVPDAVRVATASVPRNPFENWHIPIVDSNTGTTPPPSTSGTPVSTPRVLNLGSRFSLDVAGAETGAMVMSRGLRHFDTGGVSGTDSVFAALTPGELIMTELQQGHVAHLMQSGAQLARSVGSGATAAAGSVANHFTIHAIDAQSFQQALRRHKGADVMVEDIGRRKRGLDVKLARALAGKV